MKKLITFFAALLLFSTFSTVSAQLAKDSWSVGFGFAYPRYFSSDLRPVEDNYGGFLSLQRNFTESVSMRLKGYYLSLNGRVPGGWFLYDNGTVVPSGAEDITTTILMGDVDFIYHFVPCESVSPYLFVGGGIAHVDPDWDGIKNNYAKAATDFKWNAGLGVNWSLGADWKLSTELTWHNTSSKVEGILNNNRQGVFGSNTTTFLTIDVGAQYYFGQGEPSKLCQLYDGISVDMEGTDYERIENIVKKYIPREVVKEVVVEVPKEVKQNWVLVGVKFDFNKYSLKTESYPILWHATQVLLSNPDLKVEIQGHTDAVGSESYNMTLGEKRAQTVKDYLVARGISADRLSIKSFGESAPIASNDTAEGRALNRRIEFKVLD